MIALLVCDSSTNQWQTNTSTAFHRIAFTGFLTPESSKSRTLLLNSKRESPLSFWGFPLPSITLQMKTIRSSFSFAAVLISLASCATMLMAAPSQRANSCVVLKVENENVDSTQYSWEFELTIPGQYVTQLICPIAQADGDPAAQVSIDGNSFDDALKKVYQIEDGIVWQTTKAISLKSGSHRITVSSTLQPSTVRLASEAYEKSRIRTSSDRFYEPWLKMHRSQSKQAALSRYCLLYTSPSPRDLSTSRMPSSA